MGAPVVPAARVLDSGAMPTDVLIAQLPNTITGYGRHHPGYRRRGPGSHRLQGGWLDHRTRVRRHRPALPIRPRYSLILRLRLRTVCRTLAALTAVALAAGTAGCAIAGNPSPTSADDTSAFIVSRAVFEQAFPDRDPFYSYNGLIAALRTYPAFTTTGDDATRRREAAAFLANVDHETGGLKYVVEQNTANYGSYCDNTKPYGCPAGTDAYYGRGPVQLSWNYNYRTAGEAIGIDLLANPAAVERDPAVAWSTGLWFWNTQLGAATATAHDAMVGGRGFGATIRSFNGALECDGRNTEQVQNRVQAYQRFTTLLDVPPGDNLSC